MSDGATTTQKNWQVLQRLVVLYFSSLREAHPDWDIKTLQNHVNLPATGLLIALAEEAGFEMLSNRQENEILRAVLQGVHSPSMIAAYAKVPTRKVQEFLDRNRIPYGKGAYGQLPWGTPSAAEGLPRPKSRRISMKGQLSYKGRVYGLGTDYACQQCWIEEAGERILIHCPNRQTLALAKKS